MMEKLKLEKIVGDFYFSLVFVCLLFCFVFFCLQQTKLNVILRQLENPIKRPSPGKMQFS